MEWDSYLYPFSETQGGNESVKDIFIHGQYWTDKKQIVEEVNEFQLIESGSFVCVSLVQIDIEEHLEMDPFVHPTE